MGDDYEHSQIAVLRRGVRRELEEKSLEAAVDEIEAMINEAIQPFIEMINDDAYQFKRAAMREILSAHFRELMIRRARIRTVLEKVRR